MTGQLELLSNAEQALVAANTVPELGEVVDMAEAARILAQRAHLGQAAENLAALIKLRAQRKAGELLAEMLVDGRRSSGRGRAESQGATPLSELGVSKTQSSRWQKLAEFYTDDELQLIGERATADDVSLSYQDLIRQIRAGAALTGRPPKPTAAPRAPMAEDTRPGEFDALIAAALEFCAASNELAQTNGSDALEVENRRALAFHDLMLAAGYDCECELDEEVGEAHAASANDEDVRASSDVNGDSVTAEGAAASPATIDDDSSVLCAYPGCRLEDEHDGDHEQTETLTDYAKAPKHRSNAEAWACTQIDSLLAEQPDLEEAHAIQQELYAGVEEPRAIEIRDRLRELMVLTDYLKPTNRPAEQGCRLLVAKFPKDHPRVSEIQQELYRGVSSGTAISLKAELKRLLTELKTAAK